MRIEHIAMYVHDLEGARNFFVKYFNAESNEAIIIRKQKGESDDPYDWAPRTISGILEKLYYCTSKNFEARQDHFICSTTRRRGPETCTSHFIRAVVLEEGTLRHMQLVISCIASPEDAFRKALGVKRNAEVRKELAAKRRILQQADRRQAGSRHAHVGHDVQLQSGDHDDHDGQCSREHPEGTEQAAERIRSG